MATRLVCIVGPTASGKSALALACAERVGGEIVSADARQIHRGLDIGTGKPTAEERARLPHHGLDLVGPGERFDAARYCAAADAAIAGIATRRRPAIVVGGTGLYVRALLYGLCPAPPAHPRLRAVLRRWIEREGAPALHRRLALIDPAASARIHAHDPTRIVRAIEVALTSGRRLSAWQAAHRFGTPRYDALVLGLEVATPVLDARIAVRVEAMVAAGWLAEVERLLAAGHAPDAPVWRTLGYPEMRAVVEGRWTLAEGVAATVRATRRYAKRQRTWFRHEPAVQWRDPVVAAASILDETIAFAGGARVANPGSRE